VKNDKKHIDNLFNESLNQRTFDIPEAFLDDLNNRLDAVEKRKKKRDTIWWSFVLFSGISLLLLFLQIQKNNSTQSNSGKLTGSGKTNTLESYETSDLKAESENNQEEKPSRKTYTPAENISGTNKSVGVKARTKHQHRISKNQFTKKSTSEQTKNNPSLDYLMKTQVSGNKTIHDNDNDNDNSNSNSTIPEGLERLKEKPQKLILADTIAIAQEIKDALKDSTTISDTIQVANSADTASNHSEDAVNKTNELKEKGPNTWKKEVQLYGGLGTNFTTDLTPTTDSSGNEVYLKKINESKSFILTPSFGVNGNLSYKKLTFGLGLSYTQTGEKYTIDTYLLKDSTISEYIIDTIMVYDDSLGIWVPQIHDTTIFHTVQYQDSVPDRMTLTNRYSWISIPLHFGYRFEFGEYELVPRIGAQFNFGIAKNTGRFPNENFSHINDHRALKFTVSYLIQLEARRNFNRWHVFVNPYFKSMINPAISTDLIRRRYSSWGIQFGVGLKL
jgi:hypothetical protein